jgi:hypothetical protein
VGSGLVSSLRSTPRATNGSIAQTPKQIESPPISPTLALAPALALPPATAPARAEAPALPKTASSAVKNVIEVPLSSGRTLPTGSATRQRSSPSEVSSVAVVSAGAVVDAPRRAAKDAASGVESPVVAPSVASGAPAAATPPRATRSWFGRLFSSDPPEVVQPLNAFIHVAVDRGVATVTIDGIDRGTAPVTAHVNAGHHTVTVDGALAYTFPSTGVVVARRDTARVLFRAAKSQ